MVSFNLITGFLGSGKTTLLSKLLKELAPHKRIAVIQNEFASTGVDGKELQRNAPGFYLIEINNGSVFCVCQLNNFEQTIQDLLAQYNPEIIFLEASGLADPISIVELLQTSSLKDKITLDKIISLVDAPNFFRGLRGLVRFKHQIMIADTIIINKTDLFTGELSDLHDAITQLNPYAELIPTQYAEVEWSRFESFTQKKTLAAKRFVGVESEGRPTIKACVLRTHDKISENGLREFIVSLQAQCPRMKGFINLLDGRMVSVHSVYDTLEVTEIHDYMGPTEFIAFGEGIDLPLIRSSFKAFCSIS